MSKTNAPIHQAAQQAAQQIHHQELQQVHQVTHQLWVNLYWNDVAHGSITILAALFATALTWYFNRRFGKIQTQVQEVHVLVNGRLQAIIRELNRMYVKYPLEQPPDEELP